MFQFHLLEFFQAEIFREREREREGEREGQIVVQRKRCKRCEAEGNVKYVAKVGQ